MSTLRISDVLGMDIHATSLEEATHQILNWARARESRMVCAADAHMAMRYQDEPAFRTALEAADLITPDGMSLVWIMRWKGQAEQTRVCGPDLTLALCQAAATQGISVGFWGGAPEVLEALTRRFRTDYPTLRIGYAYSPPFRPLEDSEDHVEMERIKSSGTQLLFVGLGCPKQELWMADHKGHLPVVMAGVGAAFDFHAGRIRRAPTWVQRAGLEWAFRILADPGRMVRRALKYYPRVIWHLGMARIRSLRS